MSQIILNDEQAKLLASSHGPIELRDLKGNLLAVAQLAADAKRIAVAKKRLESGEPGIPSRKVQALLQALDEADSNGATNEELRELSKRLLDFQRT